MRKKRAMRVTECRVTVGASTQKHGAWVAYKKGFLGLAIGTKKGAASWIFASATMCFIAEAEVHKSFWIHIKRLFWPPENRSFQNGHLNLNLSHGRPLSQRSLP